MQVSWIVIAVVLGYMAIMLFIGWYAKNRIESNSDSRSSYRPKRIRPSLRRTRTNRET